jgi:5-methylcytosine-specific restriction protein B
VLAKFLGPHDERIGLLRALNEAIEDHDRDFRIGPSYLMRPDAADPAGLERVWKYDLLPLLEEHYYDRMSRSEVHDQFGLPALRRSLEPGFPAIPAADTGSDEIAGE